MSYEPTQWKKGDVVTSEKLNKIEGALESMSGAGADPFVFMFTQTGNNIGTISATFDEIEQAIAAGRTIVMLTDLFGNIQINNFHYAMDETTGTLKLSAITSVSCLPWDDPEQPQPPNTVALFRITSDGTARFDYFELSHGEAGGA